MKNRTEMSLRIQFGFFRDNAILRVNCSIKVTVGIKCSPICCLNTVAQLKNCLLDLILRLSYKL